MISRKLLACCLALALCAALSPSQGAATPLPVTDFEFGLVLFEEVCVLGFGTTPAEAQNRAYDAIDDEYFILGWSSGIPRCEDIEFPVASGQYTTVCYVEVCATASKYVRFLRGPLLD